MMRTCASRPLTPDSEAAKLLLDGRTPVLNCPDDLDGIEVTHVAVSGGQVVVSELVLDNVRRKLVGQVEGVRVAQAVRVDALREPCPLGCTCQRGADIAGLERLADVARLICGKKRVSCR